MMTYMAMPVTLMGWLGSRLPYVLTLQDGDPFEHVFGRRRIKIILPILRAGFRNADIVQTISTFLAEWPRKMGYRGVIEVVPNGTDVARFSAAPPADIGRKEGEVVLATASRLVPKNALDDVIRALPLMPANIVFAIFGSGPEEANLRTLVDRLGVKERVRFFGSIDNRDLPAYLHASDIFIRPSRSEGMGISFVEAFAAGRPVIATQEGGIADFLFDAKRNPEKPTTGWAVDRDNPPQIAEAVKDILSNPEQTLRVVEEARRLATARYDWRLIAKDMREKVFGRVFEK
jgi:glycosyltransferase involved in cell wall biosynthesis